MTGDDSTRTARRETRRLARSLFDSATFATAAARFRGYLDEHPDDRRMRRLLAAAEKRDMESLLRRSEIQDGRYRRRAYRVSVVVSTYRSAGFIAECLEDLAAQTLGDAIEIIVVDANSPEDERRIVREFQQSLDNLRYVRTPERIGIYAAWNLGIVLAASPSLTTFSTNDRLRKEACEILATALDNDPLAVLVYGDTLITTAPHERFDRNSATMAYYWAPYRYEDHLDNVTVGPHAMWRASLHADFGYFDTRYLAIADQDFWLRIGRVRRVRHVPEFTGLYWHDSDSLSSRHLQQEWGEIRARHRKIGGPRLRSSSAAGATDERPASLKDRDTRSEIARHEAFLAEYPQVGFVHGLLAQQYFRAGRREAAIAQARRAISLQPGNPDFRRSLVSMLLQTERLEDALAEGRALLALKPVDLQLMLVMGDICLRLRRTSEARDFYSAVLRLDPGHAGASQRLQRL